MPFLATMKPYFELGDDPNVTATKIDEAAYNNQLSLFFTMHEASERVTASQCQHCHDVFYL